MPKKSKYQVEVESLPDDKLIDRFEDHVSEWVKKLDASKRLLREYQLTRNEILNRMRGSEDSDEVCGS